MKEKKKKKINISKYFGFDKLSEEFNRTFMGVDAGFMNIFLLPILYPLFIIFKLFTTLKGLFILIMIIVLYYLFIQIIY